MNDWDDAASNDIDARGCGTLEHLRNEAEWTRTYAAGRVCGHDGCVTTLSRYNPGDYCGAHHREHFQLRYLGRRFAVCGDCGEVRNLPPSAPELPLCLACRRKLARAEKAAPEPVRKPDAVQRAQRQIPRRAVIVAPSRTYETELA